MEMLFVIIYTTAYLRRYLVDLNGQLAKVLLSKLHEVSIHKIHHTLQRKHKLTM